MLLELPVGTREPQEVLDDSLEAVLKGQGMEFTTPDRSAFQAALTKAGFYKEWEKKFGDKLWSALEGVTGPLA